MTVMVVLVTQLLVVLVMTQLVVLVMTQLVVLVMTQLVMMVVILIDGGDNDDGQWESGDYRLRLLRTADDHVQTKAT